MKPYEDDSCPCHEIEQKIDDEFCGEGWNTGVSCEAWAARSTDLEDNDIVFEAYADECYGCTCPTCGRVICTWCV